MARAFTVYWKPDGYDHFNPGDAVQRAYGTFGDRVVPGDRVFVTNVQHGAAHLLGAFTVAKVGSREIGLSPSDELVGEPHSSTLFALRPIPTPLAQALRFKSKQRPKLLIRPDGAVDGQTLRSLRELEPQSAAALEALLKSKGQVPSAKADDGPVAREQNPIYDDDGEMVQSNFSVFSADENTFDVILGYRWGPKGTAAAMNPGYAQGLRVLLRRLADVQASVMDARVESIGLIKRGLTEDARRVHGVALPIPLDASTDTDDLASKLQIGQMPVGSVAPSGKGNQTRRLLLRVVVLGVSREELEAQIAAGKSVGNPLPLGPISPDAREEEFDPKNILDARKRVERSLMQREGQPAFRARLLVAYEGRCAISGCDLVEILEAAHIVPYWGPQTNHLQNGLLLRADLHTLFDRGLFGIVPATGKVTVAATLKNSEHYKFLDGATLRPPTRAKDRPGALALQRHLDSITKVLA